MHGRSWLSSFKKCVIDLTPNTIRTVTMVTTRMEVRTVRAMPTPVVPPPLWERRTDVITEMFVLNTSFIFAAIRKKGVMTPIVVNVLSLIFRFINVLLTTSTSVFTNTFTNAGTNTPWNRMETPTLA